MSPDEILTELRRYTDLGLIEYVIPTEPLGEEWVLGITDNQGQPSIAKMSTDEARGFCIGVSALANCLAKRNGLMQAL